MSKVQLFDVGESLISCLKVMMLQSCYAVFANSILNSVSFDCFLSHVKLEKELLAAWNQVLWPCKRRSKTTTGYMDGPSNQEKKYAKKLYLLTFVKPQPVSWLETKPITDAGI